jgi:hypothetical protein
VQVYPFNNIAELAAGVENIDVERYAVVRSYYTPGYTGTVSN